MIDTSHKIGLAEQISCVNRELGMRQKVYPNRVATGRMSQDRADYEMACMEAVADTLIDLREAKEEAAALQELRERLL